MSYNDLFRPDYLPRTVHYLYQIYSCSELISKRNLHQGISGSANSQFLEDFGSFGIKYVDCYILIQMVAAILLQTWW